MHKKNLAPSISYDDGLLEDLKDPEVAVIYLNTILADTDKGMQKRFLNALRYVAKAHGITKLALQTDLQRESLRKALSQKGNPTISTLLSLLKALGLRLCLDTKNSDGSEKKKGDTTHLLTLQKKLNDIQSIIGNMVIKELDRNSSVFIAKDAMPRKLKTIVLEDPEFQYKPMNNIHNKSVTMIHEGAYVH